MMINTKVKMSTDPKTGVTKLICIGKMSEIVKFVMSLKPRGE